MARFNIIVGSRPELESLFAPPIMIERVNYRTAYTVKLLANVGDSITLSLEPTSNYINFDAGLYRGVLYNPFVNNTITFTHSVDAYVRVDLKTTDNPTPSVILVGANNTTGAVGRVLLVKVYTAPGNDVELPTDT